MSSWSHLIRYDMFFCSFYCVLLSSTGHVMKMCWDCSPPPSPLPPSLVTMTLPDHGENYLHCDISTLINWTLTAKGKNINKKEKKRKKEKKKEKKKRTGH